MRAIFSLLVLALVAGACTEDDAVKRMERENEIERRHMEVLEHEAQKL